MNLDSYRFSGKILRLANLDLKRRNAHLKVLNLTFEQSDTLQYVWFHPDCSIRNLAEFLEVSHQTAQGIVSRMERKNLLQRIPSPVDARSVMLRLIESGKVLVNRIFENGTITGSVILHGMNEDEQKEFARLIDLAITALQNDHQ